MGFSVSGAAAIIFISLFIGFGMWYTAGMNSFERITDAQSDRTDRVVDTRNTEIEIVSADYNQSGEEEVSVVVDNTGAAQLSVSETDLLVDGQYVNSWNESSVEGNSETDLWLAGEQLVINASRASAPERVKVVADTGVADTNSSVKDHSP
jgi:flagellar protein FlaF